METANDFNRYGLATMIGWNILLVILVMMVSTVKGISSSRLQISLFYVSNELTDKELR